MEGDAVVMAFVCGVHVVLRNFVHSRRLAVKQFEMLEQLSRIGILYSLPDTFPLEIQDNIMNVLRIDFHQSAGSSPDSNLIPEEPVPRGGFEAATAVASCFKHPVDEMFFEVKQEARGACFDRERPAGASTKEI
jgi:hypothetical protein